MNSRLKRSEVKANMKEAMLVPVSTHRYQPVTTAEIALDNLGYNPLEFELIGKTIDNLKFRKIKTRQILDLRF